MRKKVNAYPHLSCNECKVKKQRKSIEDAVAVEKNLPVIVFFAVPFGLHPFCLKELPEIGKDRYN